MIEIKKGTEPKELLEYRKQEFASYADMKGDVKEKVMKVCFRNRDTFVHTA